MTIDKEDLKAQWKNLWNNQFTDRQRAEEVATKDYHDLFIDEGTVLHATRDFENLAFKEIIKKHSLILHKSLQANPVYGGYGVFIKNVMKKQSSKITQGIDYQSINKMKKQQLKKRGRGWLHF